MDSTHACITCTLPTMCQPPPTLMHPSSSSQLAPPLFNSRGVEGAGGGSVGFFRVVSGSLLTGACVSYW